MEFYWGVCGLLLGLYAGFSAGRFEEWAAIVKHLVRIGDLEPAEEIRKERHHA